MPKNKRRGKIEETEKRVPPKKIVKRVPPKKIVKRVPPKKIVKRVPPKKIVKRVPPKKIVKRVPPKKIVKRRDVRKRNYTRAELAQLVALAGAFGVEMLRAQAGRVVLDGSQTRTKLKSAAEQFGQAAVSEIGGVSSSTISRWVNQGIPAGSQANARAVVDAVESFAGFGVDPEKLRQVAAAVLARGDMPAVRFVDPVGSVRARVQSAYNQMSAAETAGAQLSGNAFYESAGGGAGVSSAGGSDYARAMAQDLRGMLRGLGRDNPVILPGDSFDRSGVKGERRSGEWSSQNPMSLAQVYDYIRGANGARPLPGFFAIVFDSAGNISIFEMDYEEQSDSAIESDVDDDSEYEQMGFGDES